MTIDCQWIEKNLEAVLSDDLTAEDSRLSRSHIEGCEPCRKEVQAMIAIDPLIKKYFQAQLSRAAVSRSSGAPLWRRRAWSVAAVAAVAAVLFAVVLRSPQIETSQPPSQTQTASTEASSVIKKEDVTPEGRAKPSPATPGDSTPAPTIDAGASGFLITDLAGYSRSLEDFRGFTTLIGYWHTDQPESIARLERLYQTFGTNAKLRLIGVTSQRVPKPANTTFPVFYNAGSSVLANPGEFVLLTETGAVRMRGSLSKDFDGLSKALRN